MTLHGHFSPSSSNSSNKFNWIHAELSKVRISIRAASLIKGSERPKKRQILPRGGYASSSFDAGDVAGGDGHDTYD